MAFALLQKRLVGAAHRKLLAIFGALPGVSNKANQCVVHAVFRTSQHADEAAAQRQARVELCQRCDRAATSADHRPLISSDKRATSSTSRSDRSRARRAAVRHSRMVRSAIIERELYLGAWCLVLSEVSTRTF